MVRNAEQMLQRFVIVTKITWEEDRAEHSFKGSTSESNLYRTKEALYTLAVTCSSYLFPLN